MAKEKEKATDLQTAEDQKEKGAKGSPLKIILIAVLSLLFLLLVFLLLLRLNVFGLGTALGQSLKNWPLAHVYLPPEVFETEIDPETGEPIVVEPEETMEELKEIIKLNESELKKKTEEVDILLKQVQSLKAENERLAVFEKNQLAYEQDKRELDDLIVHSGDQAAFADWYQKMNPDNAARLYQQTMTDLAVKEELDKLTKVYSEMKPKPAAKVLESMSTTRLEMVAMIIKNLDTVQAGKIMNELEPKVAARITAYLYPEQQERR